MRIRGRRNFGVIDMVGGMESILDISNLVSDEMALVDKVMLDVVACDTRVVEEVNAYLVRTGGKRLRAMTTLLIGKMFNGSLTFLAAAVELMHHATLLHDDVIDEGDMRRGSVSANRVWGNKVSILVGDFILSVTFSMLVSMKSLEVVSVFTKAASMLAEGEIMQMNLCGNILVGEVDYMKVITAKTAALFLAAYEAAGILLRCSEHDVNMLRNIGLNTGIAFQLIDDALDYTSTAEMLGKKIGGDFNERKVTLPILITFSKCTAMEKDFLYDCFVNTNDSDDVENFNKILTLIQKYDAIDVVLNRARVYTQKACDMLLMLPNSVYRQALLELIEFLLMRGC